MVNFYMMSKTDSLIYILYFFLKVQMRFFETLISPAESLHGNTKSPWKAFG